MNETMIHNMPFIILIFIVVGGFILIFRALISPINRIYKSYSHVQDGETPDPHIVQEMQNNMRSKIWFLLPVLFTLFILMGCIFSYFFFFKPMNLVRKSQNWPAVVCNIHSSRVRVGQGEDNSIYSIEIIYSYKYNDKEYTSRKYNFWDMGSSFGYERKKEIVNTYSSGSEAFCYVNPEKPSQAVLNREKDPEMKYLKFIPFVFVFIGIIGVIYHIRKFQRDKALINS